MGRTETDRKITNEPWSSMQRAKENEQDHSAERTEKCCQKEFDRADIVRDVRLRPTWRSYTMGTPEASRLVRNC
jgi:hypothetical protein